MKEDSWRRRPRDHRVRLLHGRYRPAASRVRAGVYRAWDPTVARRRCHQAPDGGLVTPAPGFRPGISIGRPAVSNLRPGQQVHRYVRCYVFCRGVRIIFSPPQAPRANAVCERIVGTLRREVFDRLLVINECHLW